MSRFLLSALLVSGLFFLAACPKKSEEQKPEQTKKTRPLVDPQTAGPRPDSQATPQLSPIPETPLSAEETASCNSEKNLGAKVACLGALAQRHRDPRYCDVIAKLSQTATKDSPKLLQSGTAENACRRTIAIIRNNPALCAEIGQVSMAASCLSYFAMKKRDPSLCDLGKGEAIATCYLNEAARTHNLALCEKTGKYLEDCKKRLGAVTP